MASLGSLSFLIEAPSSTSSVLLRTRRTSSAALWRPAHPPGEGGRMRVAGREILVGLRAINESHSNQIAESLVSSIKDSVGDKTKDAISYSAAGSYAEPQDTGVRKSFIVNGENKEITYFHAFIDGVDFVFVDNHVFHRHENNSYGGDRLEILERMVLLCKAAVEIAESLVSSTKDSVGDKTKDAISYSAAGSSTSNPDLRLTSAKIDIRYNGGLYSDSTELSKAAVDTSRLKDVDLQDTTDVATEEENIETPPLAGVNVMNVVIVAAECAPWSKTGGLGDVAGALPKALSRRGHRVMVVAPRYGSYAEPQDTGVRKSFIVNGKNKEITYFHAFIDGVDFVFVDNHVFHRHENNIYGGDRLEILERMVLLCKAAVEAPWHVPCGGVCYGDGNLAFVANDWHTALLPVYLKAYYRDNGLMKYARSTLVIHNIAHQGRGPLEDFSHVDLPDHYIDLFKLHDPVGGVHFNIFAAGLKTADRVVTVSHGYSWELKTSEGGWGLDNIINENGWKLQGIVNGIDTKEWNPELDVHLKSDGFTNYSLETLQTGKAQCKAALQKELGLSVADVPLIGFIGRLDNQKGVDLIAEAIPWIVSQEVQLVMLGTGRSDLEDMLRRFESQHRDKVRGWVGFSVKTSHRITAGADILLMPSRFEPCGLNQLYAMRYGTVPVVHAVGGLRDTVQQFDPYSETGLGWAFHKADAGSLKDALGNCLNTYWNYKDSWKGLQKRGMTQDLSWDNAAQRYEEVFVAAKYQW